MTIAIVPSLDDLAATANREHALCTTHGRTALGHAIAAGDALLIVRENIEAGEWQRWLVAHFHGNMDTARLYVRLAAHKDKLPPDIGVTEAKRFLTGLPEAAPRARVSTYDPELREEAVALAEHNVPLSDIARHVDAPPSTVRYWIDPEDQGKRIRDNAARGRKAREALRRQEPQQEVRKAVRSAGKALSEAYSMAERMQNVLAQALDETEGTEARVALTEAIRWHHKTRDEIVRALGVSP